MASRLDQRMEQIRADRAARRQDGLGRNDEIYRIEESTETINRGMSDPLNWLLMIGAIVGIPFTGGLSLALGIWALLRMTANGKAYVQAIQPTKADLVNPGLGCARIAAAIGSLLILLGTVALFIIAIVFML